MAVNSFNAQNPPVTTKGDVFTFSTIPTRLGVGANNTVLTADSTAATGLKWVAPASGGASPIYLSKPTSGSVYYTSTGTNSSLATTASLNAGTLSATYYVPLVVPAITAIRIAMRTASTWGATGNVMRLGIYNNDATLNIPTTVLLDAGTIAPAAASTDYEITISQALSAGLYWLAAKTTTAAGVGANTYQGSLVDNAGLSPLGFSFTSAQATSSRVVNGYTETQAAGALATAGTLSFSGNILPRIAIGY